MICHAKFSFRRGYFCGAYVIMWCAECLPINAWTMVNYWIHHMPLSCAGRPEWITRYHPQHGNYPGRTVSNLWYKRHPSRQQTCWSLRCSWSIACRRCSNYIFILGLTTVNTWLQCIGQRQLQDETRNNMFLGLGAPYIRDVTVDLNSQQTHTPYRTLTGKLRGLLWIIYHLKEGRQVVQIVVC